jgi:hypothetical protein
MDKNKDNKNTGNKDRREEPASVRNTVDTPPDRDPGNQSKNPGQGDTRTPKSKTTHA